MSLLVVFLFYFPAAVRCRSAEQQLSGVQDALRHSTEQEHDELFSPDMERNDSRISIIELDEVNVCFQFACCLL